MVRRLMRLYPLFALSIALGALTAGIRSAADVPGSLDPGQIAASVLLNGLMLPAPLGRPLFPLNVPAWSLFFEVLANAALVLLLFRLPRLGLAVFCALAGFALALSVADAGTANTGALWDEIDVALLRTAFSFSAGLLVAAFAAVRLSGQGLAALACFAAIALGLHGGSAEMTGVGYDLAFIVLISPLLLYLGSCFETGRWVAAGAAFIGEISYALYAIHSPLIRIFRLANAEAGLPTWVIAPLYLGIAVVLAWAATRYFDTWARRTFKGIEVAIMTRKELARGQ